MRVGDGLPLLVPLIWMGMVFLAGLGLVAYAGAIWLTIDALVRPDWQWQATGQNKVLWIVLGALSVLACQVMALVVAPLYFFTVRPKLAAVPSPPWAGQPGVPGGWPAPPGQWAPGAWPTGPSPGWGPSPGPGPGGSPPGWAPHPAAPASGQAPPQGPPPGEGPGAPLSGQEPLVDQPPDHEPPQR